MSNYADAALITLLNVLLIALASYFVGRARGKHGIKAPATTGHPDFDRAFRAHINPIDQTVMFLPSLGVATLYGAARIAAWLGYAWLAARLWFLFGYLSEAGRRSPGFTIAALANLALLGIAFWGLLPPLLRIG
jgi:uncharacterized MAPEG superfamily protein